MSWSSAHTGQVNDNEIVISDYAWSDLMPIFEHDSGSSFIVKACYDPLIWYDADQSVWPHLAESFTMLNDSCVRITARQGVKWQNDSGSLFTDEYFDIYDVYFTLYCWKYVSNDIYLWGWIDDMVIIDQWTMDISIDGDPGTTEKEPYVDFLPALSSIILPEHYLNQTQLPDGITPDITDPAWNSLSTHCIGTGLFTLSNYTESVETNLAVNPYSWWKNDTITNDPALAWETRFGDFSGDLDYLKLRIIPSREFAYKEFEAGKIDLVSVTYDQTKRNAYCLCPDYAIQSDLIWQMGYFGYNMREERPVLGSREPALLDPSFTKGLCIRKAISYAMNREEMNNIIHGGEFEIVNHPIYQKHGVWCNPDIIVYNHDLDEAQKYMNKAGGDLYGSWTPSNNISIISIISGIITVFTATTWILKAKKKENKK
jgi:ABC-type transport system substrate-binding protein